MVCAQSNRNTNRTQLTPFFRRHLLECKMIAPLAPLLALLAVVVSGGLSGTVTDSSAAERVQRQQRALLATIIDESINDDMTSDEFSPAAEESIVSEADEARVLLRRRQAADGTDMIARDYLENEARTIPRQQPTKRQTDGSEEKSNRGKLSFSLPQSVSWGLCFAGARTRLSSTVKQQRRRRPISALRTDLAA